MFKKLLSNEFVNGTAILFISINFFNFLNYFFHFIMGRMLKPADYGVLAVLMSILSIYNVPTEAIQNLVSRYTSKFNFKGGENKIKSLMTKSLKKGGKISIIMFILATAIAFPLAKFLNINFWLIFVSNIFIFYSFIAPINKGIMQGRKKFGLLGLSLIIDSGLKLFFSISLVLLGFKIFGAVTGVLLGVLSGLVFSFYFNRDILEKKGEKTELKNLNIENYSYFITTFIIFVALSLDIILARRFFSPELAGKYSVISMIGKMIFFGTIAIGKAMFPLTSEKYDRQENSLKLFIKSFFIILTLDIISIIIFLLFPEIIIDMLYGNQYTDVAYLMVYSGISLSFLSLSNLNLFYALSTRGITRKYLLLVFLFVEILLLWYFSNNLLNYTLAFMFSNIIMFIGSFFLIKGK